jgi:hypothetical protein
MRVAHRELEPRKRTFSTHAFTPTLCATHQHASPGFAHGVARTLAAQAWQNLSPPVQACRRARENFPGAP